MQPIPWTERPPGALVGVGSTLFPPHRSKQTMMGRMDDRTDGWMDDETDGCTSSLMHMCVCVFDDTFAHRTTFVFHFFSTPLE
jgi:hypothetical protein